MKHKQFYGSNLQDAMHRAIHKMGNEVVLLESKSINIGNRLAPDNRLIQITVGLPDKSGPTGENSLKKSSNRANNMRTLRAPNHHFTLSEPNPAGLPHFNHIYSVSDELPDFGEIPAPFRPVCRRLVHSGILLKDLTDFVQQILRHSPLNWNLSEAEALRAIEQEVATLIESTSSAMTRQKNPRIIAFVGPTGVGKTTTIMKLAINPLIATGKIFSRITGIPFREIRGNELSAKLNQLQEYDLILVDTPGRSPFFPNHFAELKALLTTDQPIDIRLVLSATADLDDIFLSTGLLSLLEPSGLIITKLDETARPGKLVSILKGTQIPIDYFCDGQNVTDNIHLANGEKIWEQITKVL
jgi:flagellar biosynthesis protein FlhF